MGLGLSFVAFSLNEVSRLTLRTRKLFVCLTQSNFFVSNFQVEDVERCILCIGTNLHVQIPPFQANRRES